MIKDKTRKKLKKASNEDEEFDLDDYLGPESNSEDSEGEGRDEDDMSLEGNFEGKAYRVFKQKVTINAKAVCTNNWDDNLINSKDNYLTIHDIDKSLLPRWARYGEGMYMFFYDGDEGQDLLNDQYDEIQGMMSQEVDAEYYICDEGFKIDTKIEIRRGILESKLFKFGKFYFNQPQMKPITFYQDKMEIVNPPKGFKNFSDNFKFDNFLPYSTIKDCASLIFKFVDKSWKKYNYYQRVRGKDRKTGVFQFDFTPTPNEFLDNDFTIQARLRPGIFHFTVEGASSNTTINIMEDQKVKRYVYSAITKKILRRNIGKLGDEAGEEYKERPTSLLSYLKIRSDAI